VSPSDIYEAVHALSRSIAGRNDLSSLLSGVAESLQRIVAFDFAALILHDREANSMRSYVLDAAAPADLGPTRRLPVEQDPAGWVWVHQQPLVSVESRWPEFTAWVRTAGRAAYSP
jgi:transcriptional regulator with GAF, ATPase, and Fis domain